MNTKKSLYYYEVVLNLAVKKYFIYSSPYLFKEGDSVLVPFKNKIQLAIIIKALYQAKKYFQKKTFSSDYSFKVKSILSSKTEYPNLSLARRKWLCWLCKYYHYPLAQTWHLSLPSFLRNTTNFFKKQNLVDFKEPSSNLNSIILTAEQKTCLKKIKNQNADGFKTHLLHGVTGSGKTEVFFHLIEPALKKGKSALVLVPEIALTPQHIERFSARFPDQVTCLHSGLSLKEKALCWQKVLTGEKKILIGPRSALFCPIPNLAWILVDEEHEVYFKQEEKLKYHGRDSAVMLGKYLNIPVLLASATPSLESWWNAHNGKYQYHFLSKRVFKTPLPKVKIVDMKNQKDTKKSKPYWLSPFLYTEIKKTLKKKEQIALFLNRRGESAYILCSACGHQLLCANCDISLCQHHLSHLLCHYCGFHIEKPSICPKCKSDKLFSFGIGTQLVEKSLENLFPQAHITRVDRDNIKNHKQWHETIKNIEQKKTDIIIGTQMIAKGLDFPFLHLVGLLCADQGLASPDFRAGEKTFQLLTQMAGRSGRRSQAGLVVLQTFNPSHPIINTIQKDYALFAKQELKQRKKYHYPPFTKLSLIRVQAFSQDIAKQKALDILNTLKDINGLTVLGPAPAPYFRLKNKYRWHILIKSPSAFTLQITGSKIKQLFPLSSVYQIHINPDPVSMF